MNSAFSNKSSTYQFYQHHNSTHPENNLNNLNLNYKPCLEKNLNRSNYTTNNNGIDIIKSNNNIILSDSNANNLSALHGSLSMSTSTGNKADVIQLKEKKVSEEEAYSFLSRSQRETSAEIFNPIETGTSPRTSTPLAFNGNTFVRTNKKERKGLYFTEEEASPIPPPSSLPEVKSSGGSYPLVDTFSCQMDETSCASASGSVSGLVSNKKLPNIPTLKFSSPTSPSTTDEDTLEDQFEEESSTSGEEKLITFHEVKSKSLTSNKKTSGSEILESGSNNNIHIPTSNTRVSPSSGVKSKIIIMPSAGLLDGDLLTGISNNNNSNGSQNDGVKDDEGENSFSNHNTSGVGNHNYSLSASTEENFECFGEGSESCSILDSSTTESNSLQNFRDLNDSDLTSSPGGCSGNPNSITNRAAWQRTSLRRTPNNSNGEGMNHKRWGSFRNSKRGVPVVASSNALANQLYRSSSYHSSGRSSAGDGEEMYSDSSLEGEVIDLNKKVHHLEERFTVLAENQNDVDDRYTRSKQENAELSTKLFMLEEQLRDEQQRSDEKLKEEQRRHKDMLNRVDREKQLQLENLEIRYQSLEKELSLSRIENKRLEGTLDRERNENNHLNDKCSHNEREISSLREQNRELLNENRMDRETMALESAGSQQALVELKRQLECLSQFHMNGTSHSLRRNDSTDSENSELKSRFREAEEEIKRLKQQYKQLEEINEELSAQILNQGLENGRNLLMNLNTSGGADGNSLAAEFEAMSNDETDEYGFTSKSHSDSDAMAKMKTALKDQKEANHALRAYIDGILLNIVEHYPQLLEVKNKNNSYNGVSIISKSSQN